MNMFAELLNELLRIHPVKRSLLTGYLGIDSSSFRQILNGKRLPKSPEIVDSIADYLSLTSSECSKLKEAWIVEKTGPETYYRMKSVREFLYSFLEKKIIPRRTSGITFPESLPADRTSGDSCTLILDKQTLQNEICHMVLEETTLLSGRIGAMFQPDQSLLMEIFSSVHTPFPFQLDHIFCFDKSGEIDSHLKMKNLSLLSPVLSVCANKLCDYRPFYHYDSIPSDFPSVEMMPCLLLTSTYALTFQKNLQHGLLYTDKNCIRLFWNLFRKCRQLTFRLMQSFPVSDLNDSIITPGSEIYVPVGADSECPADSAVCLDNQQVVLIQNNIAAVITEVSILSAFSDFFHSQKDNDLYVLSDRESLTDVLGL